MFGSERALTGKGGEGERARAREMEAGGKKVSRLCGDWRSLVPWTGGARLANVQPSPRSTQAVSNHARAATGRTRRRLFLLRRRLRLNNNNRWVFNRLPEPLKDQLPNAAIRRPTQRSLRLVSTSTERRGNEQGLRARLSRVGSDVAITVTASVMAAPRPGKSVESLCG
ncbi:uncharacterized [Tachysurus ichikawai]